MQVALIDSVAIKHSLPGAALAAAKKLISKSRSATNSWATVLRKSIKSGDDAAQAEARQWLMTSPEALLTSAIAANRKLRTAKRQTLEQCLAVPKLLDFSGPLKEVVPVRPKAKKSGGCRMLHNHGLLHRSAQNAVVRVVGPYFMPHPFQYTQKGVHAAIRRAKTAIKTGHVYVARLDIKDFFLNFSAEALITELPLPGEVVEHVVVGRHMAVVMDQEKKHGQHAPLLLPHAHETLLLLARLGIPLGSGCSPIVGMFCVARLVWLSMPGVILLNYADDFLLLALSPKLLDEAIGKLTGAVADLPGGHFDLQLKLTGTVSKGFAFLGHHLQLVDGSLKTRPTEANLQDLYRKLNLIEVKIGKLTCGPGKVDKRAAIKCLASIHAFLDGWMAAFRECDNIERWVILPLGNLADLLNIAGVTNDEVTSAIEPWMGFEPSDYALGH